MNSVFLIESRSVLDSPHVSENIQLAADLAAGGSSVTLFLIENGVFAARKTAKGTGLSGLSKVTVLADEFSLRERAIAISDLAAGVKVSSLDPVVDAMADGQKVTWF